MFHLRRGAPVVAVAALLVTTLTGLSAATGVPLDAGAPSPTVTTTTSTTVAPEPSTSVTAPPVTTPLTDATPVPDGPPAPDPSPHIRTLLARLQVLDAQHGVAAQQLAAATAHGALAAADASLDQANQAKAAADDALASARQQLGSVAAYAYVHAGGGDFVAVLQGDSTAGGSERELFAASVDHRQQVVVDAQAAVGQAEGNLDDAHRADDDARQAAADQDTQVDAANATLDAADRELATAAANERLAVTSSSWQLSIEGPSAFTADELAEWYQAQAHGSQASVPMTDLAKSYIDQGTAEGVRGDMAFAQSIHETGWFANLDTVNANNFAGIGHCSACAGGFPFATADLGVLAQIQLLKSYAETSPTYNVARADPSLNGPAGCCQTWTQLGGVWASDPSYGPHILARYADMLEWLVARRTAAG